MKKLITTSLVAIASLSASEIVDIGTITVTTPYNTTQKLQDTTSNISVITNEDIEERGFTTLSQALNSITGVEINSNGGFGTLAPVVLDGMSNKYILVLIDGVRYNDPSSLSGASIEHINLNDVESIEILKGAQSGVWGADASAGVINIITKKAKDGFNASLNAVYGSYGYKEAGFGLSYKNSKYYAKLSISKIDTDGYSAMQPRGEDLDNYEDDGYENLTISLTAGVKFNDNHKIDLSHKVIDTKTDGDPFGNPDGVYNSLTLNTISHIAYTYSNSWGDIELFANKTKFEREYPDEAFGEKNYDGTTSEFGIKSTIKYLNDSSFLVIGADYKKFEHENNLNQSYKNQAVFITNSNRFNDNQTVITESLRFDDYDDTFDSKTTGKIGIKHNFTPIFNISANYGTAYNVPTIYNLYAPASAWGKVGNINLEPEDIKSFDISLNYGGFGIRYFHNEIENMIGFTDGYVNLDGTSTIKGYELSFKKTILEDTLLTLSYSNIDAKDKDDKDLLRVANSSLKASIDYYGIKDTHIGIYASYIGDKKDIKFNPDFSSEIIDNGNYTTVDAIINYEIDDKKTVYLKADNIFDKEYQSVYGYSSNPRSVYLGVKVEF
ncbi:Outer membrane vitamin B12 receptor BtuB [hydrothermal vent metagenome]|uniref:Outer membrane vitamin B12 receptor BtuB n=1 Tax=hydrothermal vent metagenome TaxID=652676 RepID=A0A1W1EKB3_9ZZZZ